MWIILYSNTYTLTDTLRGGNHEHIGIVMQDALYATILPMTYNAPMDPGGTAQLPTQATRAVHSKLQD